MFAGNFLQPFGSLEGEVAVAVVAGGELPEIEPVIAKPLAMAAMTESYKYVCLDFDMVSN